MSTWEVPGYTGSLELGSGASGRVVLAVHEESGVAVAVKYLSESLLTRPGFVHDFRAEARLLGGLESPYVTGLYEYVESPHGAAIVMELVDGVSLRTLLARHGPLVPEAALALLKGSLLGLADAHRVGVVHRDYKPENVLVVPDGTSKLVDFGIAVDSGTGAGVAGTPSYMAPEQWTGAPASPAADVYAATATFFECLTGRRPYSGDNFAELALQHVEAPVPAEEVPEPVRALVRRGLAKDPAQRPAQAEEFVAQLEAAAGAAYGMDWEERGRGRLAALVALLPLLLPSARSTPRTTTDSARTVLSQGPRPVPARSWLPGRPGMLVSAAAVLLGLLLTYGTPLDAGTAAQEAARALATTSAGSGTAPDGSAAPGASVSPSSTPTSTVSAGPSSSPGPSATGTAGAGGEEPSASTAPPGEATSAPPGGTEGTTAPTTTAPPAPAAPAVKSVTVSGFRQTGPTTATATVDVTTDGTGPVSVTVSWFTGNTGGQPGDGDGAPETFTRSGATTYSITVEHTFQNTGCYWSIHVTTSPVPAGGDASDQLLTRRCDLR
ncbi:serine/threonine-protein kinase [Streptomyces sp. TRM68416]|uniref:serine/threonine-protein kinase n=1 Tax=Streptomyces sp. TRM68416 TaxID=2758412 RepID=UPI0016619CDF|nr:serine/threonine-protein kinase [Streptomyces sp. TRM68416]MBD0839480.1 serine/threonine protein kinase [Streptomyces sp. TRM68416]